MGEVSKMPSADVALARLDSFLRAYPVRILKSQKLGGVTADYHCPLAGVVILLTRGTVDDLRKPALSAQGLTVLTLRRTAITRNFDGVCAFIDDTVKHALITEK